MSFRDSFDYTHCDATKTSHIDRFGKGPDEAQARGWTMVNVKADWKAVLAFETR